jgi:hypothetical protein
MGWFLPTLFASRPHEFEALALLALQALAAGIGATVGFIVGGALLARYAELVWPSPTSGPAGTRMIHRAGPDESVK